jgi:hypothetical protein
MIIIVTHSQAKRMTGMELKEDDVAEGRYEEATARAL